MQKQSRIANMKILKKGGLKMLRKAHGKSLVGLVLLCMITLISACGTTSGAKGSDNIYMYQGPDREQKLIENAKKEGVLNLYTSLNPEDLKVLVNTFEKKYGIKVTTWRAKADDIVQRMVTEARGQRFEVDALSMNGPQVEMLAREKLLSEFYTPYLKDLPPNAIPPHKLWVADRFNFIVTAWNTNKVKPEDVPQQIEDFLNPKFEGKVGVESLAVEWFATTVKTMGEEKGLEFFKQLAKNKPTLHKGYELMGQLIASGEIPIAITAYNHTIERLKQTGAPVDWKPIQPAVGRINALGLAKNAPHPYAALLFAEFQLSPEGQEQIKTLNRVPSSTKIKTNFNNFDYVLENPVITLDEWEKWNRGWDEIMLKRN
jgi:iron(III) transport system substrate-binding protein